MTNNNEDIVYYQWTEVPGKFRSDIIRLSEIRLHIATWKDNNPYYACAIPVLMGDGKQPHIVLCAGTVHMSTDINRFGKLIVGKLTDAEKQHSKLISDLYSGDTCHHSWAALKHKELTNMGCPISVFNSPMWCRKARSNKDLTPRNNMAVRGELGYGRTEEPSPRELKRVWDNMAENALCIGHCSDGFLWDAGMIKRGGIVCVPRQYDADLNISGACLKSDFRHIATTQRWRSIKV